MSKRNHIQFSALILLLIYLISNGVTLFTHNHTADQTLLSKANACERTIYFSQNDTSKNCSHKSHIFNYEGKCYKCIKSKLTSFVYAFSAINGFKAMCCSKYDEPKFQYYQQLALIFANKGPPNISPIS